MRDEFGSVSGFRMRSGGSGAGLKTRGASRMLYAFIGLGGDAFGDRTEIPMLTRGRLASMLSLVLCLGMLAGATCAGLPLATDQLSERLPDMLQEVLPGVVNIATRARVASSEHPLLNDSFFRRFFELPDNSQGTETLSAGSGVIVDAAQGYIITNYHVVEGADEIQVTLSDRRRVRAAVIGVDPESDLSVLKVQADNLKAVALGNSDALRVGHIVFAIGNPFGLSQTVTSGIVSALGRTGLGIEAYEDFIQTDASINPGNSGGALVNTKGELIGINTAIVGPGGGNVGIGFAIPSNLVSDIMGQIVRHGEVRRGELGVVAQDLTQELASAFGLPLEGGAVVIEVAEDSPASKAGIHRGDIVTRVNDRPIRSASQIRNTLGRLRAGTEVKLRIVRKGQVRTLHATISEPRRVMTDAGQFSAPLAGARFGEPPSTENPQAAVIGVPVVEVMPGSPAWHAGLRPGDIVTGVNGVSVKTVEQAQKALQRVRQGVTLNILRGNGAVHIVVR
ncbi:MAG: Do family serine endopeptidase [Gammaproteobacteria bacterium]|nr:Do family serine endopeptidase [Gammaproteobacteria bacterium]